jgi:rhodanese-related sulfurtransferase
MSQVILQINAKINIPVAELEPAWLEAAQPIADTSGLRWKIWIKNHVESEVGGIYLFDDEASVQAFLDGTIVAGTKSSPVVNAISVKQFSIMETHTAVTRGPVGPKLKPGNGLPISFNQMAEKAMTEVVSIKPADAYRRQKKEPGLLVIDVRDAAEIAETGTVPGAVNISLGSLTYKADQEVPVEWRDPNLADRSRPIITTCILGPMGALGGKLLKDMGFANVQILEGGVQAWIDAGLPVTR